ncbi:hypothetical protein, partial [Rhodococcus rhodochrous]
QVSDIAVHYADVRVMPDEEVYGKGAKRLVPETDVLSEHVALKAAAMYQSVPKIKEEMGASKLDELLDQMEGPLSLVLATMEKQGVKVNEQRLQQMGEELDAQLEKLTGQIYELAGTS